MSEDDERAGTGGPEPVTGGPGLPGSVPSEASVSGSPVPEPRTPAPASGSTAPGAVAPKAPAPGPTAPESAASPDLAAADPAIADPAAADPATPHPAEPAGPLSAAAAPAPPATAPPTTAPPEPAPVEPLQPTEPEAGGAAAGGAAAGGAAAGGAAQGSEVTGAGAGSPAARRRRISAAGAVIGLLLGLLGFALVVQLRSNAGDEQLSTERPEDLVRILSDLDARKDRLSQEISQEQTLKQQLQAGSQSRQAALAEASKRADALGILAGTLPAQGPGLRVEFSADTKAVRAADVLDAVEELRGAGAEAMQIAGAQGAAVRIIASSSFVDGANGALVIDGRVLSGPYTITVIGDPQTMQIALNIPSGVVDTVHNNGGTVSVVTPGTVQVTALHENAPPRYAKPVS